MNPLSTSNNETGFTLVELLVTTVIVGLLAVPVMSLAVTLRKNARRLDLFLGAIQLARNLQAEIQTAGRFTDSTDLTKGPEYNEQNRSDYDSVNDFHKFRAEDFTDRAGHTYEGYTVAVKTKPGLITSGQFQPTADGKTVRITIEVFHAEKKLHQVQWLR